MFFSVIIPTYNDWDSLLNCLNSLKELRFDESQFEVIVVNNNPSNKCPFNLNHKNVKIVDEIKEGSYSARNKGITVSKGRFLAFIDSDCKAHPEWLRNAIPYLNIYDLVGGKVENYIPEKRVKDISQYDYDLINGFPQEYYIDEFNGSVTANLIVKRIIFSKVGMFRDDLYSGGDIEWCQRAAKENYTICYAPEVKVYHPARSLSELAIKKRRIIGGLYKKSKLSKELYFIRKCISLLIYPVKYIFKNGERKKSLRFLFHSYYLEMIAFHEAYNILIGKKN